MIAQSIYKTLATEAAADDAGAASRFSVHFAALSATKIAGGIVDPKLTLAWLANALGAPGYVIGALTPVREAGALLPQLAVARAVRRSKRRKLFWAGGSVAQGLAALGVAVAAVTLSGAAAGWAILACLAVLAVARSFCSASYSDILARTVEKGARGTVSGAAGAVAAAVGLVFAASISLNIVPLEPRAIALAIAAAGGLWLIGGMIFARLDEPAVDVPDTVDPTSGPRSLLREDRELRRYIAVRALLISTALAPPFIVMLSGDDGARFGHLGALMLASAAASIASSYVWGRFSDRSSRRTLSAAGVLAAVALGAAAAVGFLTGGAGGKWGAAGFMFVAQIAYAGARAGRKTHLTDMETGGRRAEYAALSNSIVGILLIAGGAFGFLADVAGPEATLAAFAVLAAVGAVAALCLSEVQRGVGD